MFLSGRVGLDKAVPVLGQQTRHIHSVRHHLHADRGNIPHADASHSDVGVLDDQSDRLDDGASDVAAGTHLRKNWLWFFTISYILFNEQLEKIII